MDYETLEARRKTAIRQEAVGDSFDETAAPQYPLHLTLDVRRHRMLLEWESCEALKLAKAAGLEKL